MKGSGFRVQDPGCFASRKKVDEVAKSGGDSETIYVSGLSV